MFRRFDRLVPLLNFKQDTLSLYGDRICHCDSCYKDGCCEEWPVVGRFPGKRRL